MLIKIRARARARAFVGAAIVGSAMTFVLGVAYTAGARARTIDEASLVAVLGTPTAKTPTPPLNGVLSAQFRRAAAEQLAGGRLVNPAAPFRGKAQGRDFDCLATAVYYEARGEGVRGQQAVAQVILNRVRHPAFPKSVCAVVYQGCQFSFVCDGSMRRGREKAAWSRARTVAAKALAGAVMDDVGASTFFHARRVAPDWVGLVRVASVGSHIFYRSGGQALRGSGRTRSRDAAPVAELAERKVVEETPAVPAAWTVQAQLEQAARPQENPQPADALGSPERPAIHQPLASPAAATPAAATPVAAAPGAPAPAALPTAS